MKDSNKPQLIPVRPPVNRSRAVVSGVSANGCRPEFRKHSPIQGEQWQDTQFRSLDAQLEELLGDKLSPGGWH
jgi:hypothetical protein